jgi:hypothetical protein
LIKEGRRVESAKRPKTPCKAVVAPLATGAGVRVIAGDDTYQVEPLE